MRLLVTVATLVVARNSAAQSADVMAQAIPLVTQAAPTVGHRTLTEGYLSQPVIMTHAAWGNLRGVATFNFEGLTIDRGELSTGGYGEGYIDRRHPHTYVHELLAGWERGAGKWDASIFAGRGFVPFGSDDPMVRPFVKYPINHHLAQILERVEVVGALRYGKVIGELATFNGDEPLGPGASPDYKRFGNSWSSRLTVLPVDNLQVSGSFAMVASPEVRAGAGLDARKTSVVARYDRSPSPDSRIYGLAEFAHTDELDGDRTITRLSSFLGEGAICGRGVIVAGRAEHTARPEEETTLDPFRSVRPATDLHNLGISEWTTYTLSLAAPKLGVRWITGRPFVEIERIGAAAGNPPGIFSAVGRYGTSHVWMLSAGVRISAGSMMNMRMGRYGAAVPPSSMPPMATMSSMDDMPSMQHGMQHSMREDKCSL